MGREELIAGVIRQADVDLVVLQEATRPHVVSRLAALTGLESHAASAGRSLAYLSRVQIEHHRWVRPRFSQHAFLEVVPRDIDFHIIGVHLSAVHTAWTERRRVRELRSLLADLITSQTGPHVVMGDFNTIAPDEKLDVARLPRRLRLLVYLSGGRIRWQTIAMMLGAGYTDSFRTIHAAEAGSTFPTWDPHIRLDYAFVPKDDVSLIARCEVVTDGAAARAASDHFPLRLELTIDPAVSPKDAIETGAVDSSTTTDNHGRLP
jgi:endonuclease/exonuclease/phosphatase family metal-dependent hydrolase